MKSILRGDRLKDIAAQFELSYKSVYSVKRLYERTGRWKALPRGGHRPTKLNDEQREFIIGCVRDDCTVILGEIGNKVKSRYGVEVSDQTISRTLKGFHYSLKRVTRKAAAADTINCVEERYRYATWFNRLSRRKREKLVFTDETGFAVSMRRFTGYAPVGQRAVKTVAAIRTVNYTVFAAMTASSIIPFAIQNHAGNTQTFLSYIKLLIAFFEEKQMDNMIFLMDNVKFHHNPTIKQEIEAAGHTIHFIPPYSPFINPIENCFSQWKGKVRGANSTDEVELMRHIDEASEQISSENTRSYFNAMLLYIPRCLKREQIDG